MHTFQDFAGGLLMNPCINIYDPVMTNLTHNFSLASPVYQPNPPQEKPNLQISSSFLPVTDFHQYQLPPIALQNLTTPNSISIILNHSSSSLNLLWCAIYCNKIFKKKLNSHKNFTKKAGAGHT